MNKFIQKNKKSENTASNKLEKKKDKINAKKNNNLLMDTLTIERTLNSLGSVGSSMLDSQQTNRTNVLNNFLNINNESGKEQKDNSAIIRRLGKMKKIMTLVKIEQKEEKEKNEEEVELSKEEELQLKELSNGLYDLLKIECVLCGQEMINSTQIMFGKNNDNDEDKWKNLVE